MVREDPRRQNAAASPELIQAGHIPASSVQEASVSRPQSAKSARDGGGQYVHVLHEEEEMDPSLTAVPPVHPPSSRGTTAAIRKRMVEDVTLPSSMK